MGAMEARPPSTGRHEEPVQLYQRRIRRTGQDTKEYRKYKELSQRLWFLPAGCTRGSAALVMMKHENQNGNLPNGRATWVELENLYGGRTLDERPAQLLRLEMRLNNTTCV